MHEGHKRVDLPWQAIVGFVAAAGGVFLYLNPLETSRPEERPGFSLKLERDQDVDARLWQDPMRAAFEHQAGVRASEEKYSAQSKSETQRHTPSIEGFPSTRPYWVLPVMMPGGSYAEYSEVRLRMRKAVLEGLGQAEFTPEDGEYIGYRMLHRPGMRDPPQDMIVPFEWCRRVWTARSPAGGELPDRVLVLWLREEEFQGKPLAALEDVLRGQLKFNPAETKVRIIGPRTSTTLRAMVEELAERPGQSSLAGMEMWSATATASDALLMAGVKGIHVDSVSNLFNRQLAPFEQLPALTFRRVTLTDEAVIKELLNELQEKRGLNLWEEADEKAARRKDGIALISEWDTFYGRALPEVVKQQLSRNKLDEVLKDKYPANLLVYHYLRGIDGMVPGTAGDGGTSSKEKEKSGRALPQEQPEGVNQSDYLRRLAADLTQKHEERLRAGLKGINAVGVLGSDVYDKLLVLKALRKSLPHAVFFTVSIDARLGHPDEWLWARNLIVASPFGLTVEDQVADRLAPFRDSNQTAVYTATLMAAGSSLRESFTCAHALSPVRLYEIGRHGAFDLTDQPAEGSLQPKSPDRRPWLNATRLLLLFVVGGLITLGALWVVGIIMGAADSGAAQREEQGQTQAAAAVAAGAGASIAVRQRCRRMLQELRHDPLRLRVLTSSWLMFVLVAIVSFVIVFLISNLPALQDEPYSWNEGISIWPTETLRLLAALMALVFIGKTILSVEWIRGELEKDFGVQVEQPGQEPKRWRDRLVRRFSVRRWGFSKEKVISANGLWSRYTEAGKFKAQLVRILPLVCLFILIGMALMILLGFPSVPARGALARVVDSMFLGLSVFCSVLLTFYVADVTYLDRRLIHYLTLHDTDWPPQAFESLWGRWKFTVVPAASRAKLPEVPPSGQRVPPEDLVIDYLDIDFIARRTQVVGGLIYYPFIVISLMIISRIGIFDHWTWPVPLLMVLGCNAGYALLSAIHLRRTAETARRRALQRLDDRLIAYVAAGYSDAQEAKTIRETSAMIRAEDRGAFASISHHPIAGALLLPSGSAGLWAVLQYFPSLVS